MWIEMSVYEADTVRELYWNLSIGYFIVYSVVFSLCLFKYDFEATSNEQKCSDSFVYIGFKLLD